MRNYIIGILLVLVSCNGQKKSSLVSSNSQSKLEFPMVLIAQDEHGAFEVEETTIIRDQKRLRSFYSEVNQTRKPGLPIPIIDFSKEMVIVQCAGELNYDGSPVLNFVAETDTMVILNSAVHRAPENTSTSIRTNLFCIYKMPLTEKEVIVERNYE